MKELLDSKWTERNREFNSRLVSINRQMKEKNALRSPETVRAMYELACAELDGSARTIIATIMEALELKLARFDKSVFHKFATENFEERRKYIETVFRSRAQVTGMLNHKDIKGKIELPANLDATIRQLKMDLNHALDERRRKQVSSQTAPVQAVRQNTADSTASRAESAPAIHEQEDKSRLPQLLWLAALIVVLVAVASFRTELLSLINGG